MVYCGGAGLTGGKVPWLQSSSSSMVMPGAMRADAERLPYATLLSDTERTPPRLATGRGLLGREGSFEDGCDVRGTRRSGSSPSESRSMSESSSIALPSARSRASFRFVFALDEDVNASFDA